jgi:hypothetical protein
MTPLIWRENPGKIQKCRGSRATFHQYKVNTLAQFNTLYNAREAMTLIPARHCRARGGTA